MVKGNKKNRFNFMQLVSKMLLVVITVVTSFTFSPSESYAIAMTDPLTTATAEVSNDNTTVTVTFNTYATPTISLEDLMSNIQIELSEPDVLYPLTVNENNEINEINMTAEGALVISLNTALKGTTNSINVVAGSIMNQEGTPSAADITISDISAHDFSAPAFIGAESEDGNYVRLNFDEDFWINAPEEEDADEEQINIFLRSNMSISTDGEHFVPVLGQSGDIYQNGSRQIYLNYYNDMKVIIGPNTIIKIASGTLKDQAGNLNEEMNLHVSPPVIESTVLSSDNHDVTITFNKDIIENTNYYNSLRNNIYLIRGKDADWKGLVAEDTAEIVSGKLYIHFTEALTGSLNQISISGRALTDSYGNFQTSDRLTGLIEANVGGIDPKPADTTMPKYLDYYLSNNNQDLTFVFNEDIHNAKDDDAIFLQNIYFSGYTPNYGYHSSFPSGTTLSFSGPTMTFHSSVPLTGNNYYIQINPNNFKDTAGNLFVNYLGDYVYPQNATGIQFNNGYFSHDGRWMSLEFNSSTNLVDQTLIEGVSHLNEHITISTDRGLTYTALNALDVVTVYDNKINIFFHEAKQQGSVKIKVAANVVSDLYDAKRNIAVDKEVAYNTPDLSGYMLSNTASEFVFANNMAWSSRIQEIKIYDENIDIYRQLTSSEYTVGEGKITISKGIFLKGHYYRISVDAEGYSTKYLEGVAYKSSEIFYMTAPVMSVDNGITARINLFNNAYEVGSIGNQSVVFELFNGSTPVSIVVANLKVNTGTYSANFNVIDAATNPNYSVRVFVVSKYSNDVTNLGLNLATVKTQLEIDQATSNAENNNNNNNNNDNDIN